MIFEIDKLIIEKKVRHSKKDMNVFTTNIDIISCEMTISKMCSFVRDKSFRKHEDSSIRRD